MKSSSTAFEGVCEESGLPERASISPAKWSTKTFVTRVQSEQSNAKQGRKGLTHRVRPTVGLGVQLLHHAVNLDEVGLEGIKEALSLSVLRRCAEGDRVVLCSGELSARCPRVHFRAGETSSAQKQVHLDDVSDSKAVGADCAKSEETESCERRKVNVSFGAQLLPVAHQGYRSYSSRGWTLQVSSIPGR